MRVRDEGTYILTMHKEYVLAHTQNMLNTLVVLATHWQGSLADDSDGFAARVHLSSSGHVQQLQY